MGQVRVIEGGPQRRHGLWKLIPHSDAANFGSAPRDGIGYEIERDLAAAAVRPAQPGKATFYRLYGKRLLDILLAASMLVFFAPLIAMLAVIVARDGGAPIYGQFRVGRDGRLFRCLKLRSMAVDAEERLRHILATDSAAAAEWAENQKLTDDPRITRLGRFLRKSSLDELPQIWNVLRGDMSLVGPRPVVADEIARYGAHAACYLRVRPGLTGAWQVSGRNSISYGERVLLDVDYERDLSLKTDALILARTVKVVLWATGR